MLLNEWVKVLVHRHRPFVDGPFVDWEISLVVLVGFSRVALGAHFLTDVLAAILFGILGKPIRQGGLRSQTAVIFADVDRSVLVPVERRAQRDSNL
jgi:PAP2 superfamily